MRVVREGTRMIVRPWVRAGALVGGVLWVLVVLRIVASFANADYFIFGMMGCFPGVAAAAYFWSHGDIYLIVDRRAEAMEVGSGPLVLGYRDRIRFQDIEKVDVRAVVPGVFYQAVVVCRGWEIKPEVLRGFGRKRLEKRVEALRRFSAGG